jgi:hypothetical protein
MVRDIGGMASSVLWPRLCRVSNARTLGVWGCAPEGTIMITSRMMMPTMRHMRIFMSFHHICLRTRLAPRRKPWADWARLSVLSWSESRRAPRSETLLMLSRMMPTVLSISWCASVKQSADAIGAAIAAARRCSAAHSPGERSGVQRVLAGAAPVHSSRSTLHHDGTAPLQKSLRRCDIDGKRGQTYRLERCCAVVAILALGALLCACAGGGNVRVVGLLAVGHGGRSNGF